MLVELFILLTVNPPVTVTPEAKQTFPPAFTMILPLCVVPDVTQITSPLLAVIADPLAAILVVQPVHWAIIWVFVNNRQQEKEIKNRRLFIIIKSNCVRYVDGVGVKD